MSSMRRASRPIEQRDDVVGQVAGDRQFAPVEGGVAEAVHAVLGLDPEGHEVASRATGDDLASGDSHGSSSLRGGATSGSASVSTGRVSRTLSRLSRVLSEGRAVPANGARSKTVAN